MFMTLNFLDIQLERDKQQEGVVANRPDSFLQEAVGFIDWLAAAIRTESAAPVSGEHAESGWVSELP